MSAALQIARREVQERRQLLGAALGLGLLVSLLQFPPQAGGPHGFGQLLAIWFLLAFSPAVAVAVGSSIVGRDLAAGRLSFYFSRPLSPTSLWAGKFLGGAALVLWAFACSAVPFLLSSMQPGRRLDVNPFAIAGWALVWLDLMALAHVVTSMFRHGSRLFALDLCLGTGFAILSVALLRQLVIAGAGTVVPWLFGDPLVVLASVGVALLLAAAVQLAHGRADVQRGHVALSAATWSLALLACGALALRSTWVLGVTPADVGGARQPVFAAPHGNAVLFDGASRRGRAGFSPIFLMNGESGAWTRARMPVDGVTQPVFAADGSRAAWLAMSATWWEIAYPPNAGDKRTFRTALVGHGPRAESWEPALTLVMARLDGPAPTVEEPGHALPEGVSMALAVDGAGRVVLAGPASVFLFEAATGAVLARAPISGVIAADLRADGVVRLYQREPGGPGGAAFAVVDWTVTDGSQRERVSVRGDGSTALVARGGDLAVVATGRQSRAILDAVSGTAASVDGATQEGTGDALVLSNGSVALGFGNELRIVRPDGTTVASLPLAPRTHVEALREPAEGELAVGVWSLSLAERRTLFVDVGTGAVRREDAEILPVRAGSLQPRAEAGSLASRLCTDLDGALSVVERDGKRRVLVAAP